MASEMVERVARAIYEAWARIEGAQTTFDEMCRMNALPGAYPAAKRYHKLAFEEARAAIMAMREPTRDMLAASFDAEMKHEADCLGAPLPHEDVWWHMVGAALADAPPAPASSGGE